MNSKLISEKSCFFVRTILTVICLSIGTSILSAQNISINVNNKKLSSVLKEIQTQSHYKVAYNNSMINVDVLVSLNVKSVPLVTALDKLFEKLDISYKILDKQIILSPKNSGVNDVKKAKGAYNSALVKGAIYESSTKEPVPEAIIQIKGGKKYAVADLDGKFSIQAKEGDVLLISSMGMKSQEVQVAKSTQMTIVLESELIALDDIVVTGYQTISKERATGSFAVVTSEKIKNKLETNIIDRIEGMVPGLASNRGEIEVRGVSTINGEKSPLYVVDGIPFEGEPGRNASPLDVLNPSEIVNVTVLKDATAASIYGARSANGVIVITTKSGQVGATKVNYNGSVNFRGLPDRDYQDLMSSSEFVDFQVSLMDSFPNLKRNGEREFQNPVQSIYLDFKENKITREQMNSQLQKYRDADNSEQARKEFLRSTCIVHQHNLSFSGGSDIYKYSISGNYTGTAPYEKAQYENRFGFNFKNTFNFFKWLQIDAGLLFSQVKSDYENGISGMTFLENGEASYYMLRDDNGEPLQWYKQKSQYEIDRLNALGLMDETYIPVYELGNMRQSQKMNYLNINLAARIKIIEGLNINLRYQTEGTTGFNKQYYSKDALSVKTMINNATQMVKGIPKYNVPVGGQLKYSTLDNYSYTLRGQVDYNKEINEKHAVQALAGMEVRKVVSSGSGYYRYGYDDDNLNYSKIDELTLSKRLSGTESIDGGYNHRNQNPGIAFADNRYLSLYANASYTYNQDLMVTGSIRIDQSNLFGTDPKYRYRPLWSAGAHYVVLRNYKNWLDRLAVRVTYGINGNVSKDSGPYLIAKTTYNNMYTNGEALLIDSPPNEALIWEKTKVFNVGLDFAFFKNRLTGSFEFYNKNTSDLLGSFSMNPTLGWSSVKKNFGNMYNRGVELMLNSVNIENRNFKWTSRFIFSYNKNEITDIEHSSESAYYYYGSLNNRKGYPMGAMFSIKYKGLDNTGCPVAYKADGTETTNSSNLSVEDLEYSGTYTPKYHASFSNGFSYKGFDLSFMFIYAGGHVQRDIAANYTMSLSPFSYTSNTSADAFREKMNYWRKPGDENIPNMNPAYMYQSNAQSAERIWQYADKHIQRADYIKLRDLTVSYNFNNKLLKKAAISGLRVSLQARNLWYWAANDRGLDPETWSGSSAMATPGTHYPAEFILGLNINF